MKACGNTGQAREHETVVTWTPGICLVSNPPDAASFYVFGTATKEDGINIARSTCFVGPQDEILYENHNAEMFEIKNFLSKILFLLS